MSSRKHAATIAFAREAVAQYHEAEAVGIPIRRDVPDCRKIRYLVFLSALAFPALVAAQSIGPDELQVQAFPYVPPSSVTLRTQVRLVEFLMVSATGSSARWRA
jgi:hypothetical protein